MERYLLGFQAVRVALSVILFVVKPRNFVGYLPEVRVVKVAEGLLDYLSTICGVTLHDGVFLIGELPGLLELSLIHI